MSAGETPEYNITSWSTLVKYNFGGLDLALGTRPHATRNAYKHQMKGKQIKILGLGRQDYWN